MDLNGIIRESTLVGFRAASNKSYTDVKTVTKFECATNSKRKTGLQP
jgi:hypothetical protein